MKHTPGPWHVSPTPGTVLVTDNRGIAIVECLDRGTETANLKSNARLIAAAPELLERLEDVLEHLPSVRYFSELQRPLSEMENDQYFAIVRACEAIRKAKGE